jgi:hypothetical protein
MAAQPLRRSQFIITYGPGAILEGAEGPRIIPSLERSRLFERRNPSDSEITDLRLSEALLGGAGIVRLPSNAEVGEPDSRELYYTERFPKWSLCVQHERLYRKAASDNRACPSCPPLSDHFMAWRQASRQAIRFVRACAASHLDDVDWIGIINHNRQNCRPSYLYWTGGGGALRHINIVCPACNGNVNLGIAYFRDGTCLGRFPELGPHTPGCNQRSKMIQRGAANLRIAEIQTALTIPPRSTRLHRLLEMSLIRAILVAQQPHNKASLITTLRALVAQRLLRQAVVDEIETYPEQTILIVAGDVIAGGLPSNISDLRLQEFEALRHAAAHGAPPQPASTPGAPPQFEVIRQHVRTVTGPRGRLLRITPIDRLRVVMVQTGYRRLDPTNPPVERRYSDGQREWFPGVELFGEGIFIDFDLGEGSNTRRNRFMLQGSEASTWLDEWHNREGSPQGFANESGDHLHPVFVWWHTLAHRLINALAIDSGYSSSAVRERVFIEVGPDADATRGGVLLYTAQPGGDGTLGGLIALVPEFERVLGSALRNLDACSNDPLCGEETFSTGKYNGAACYACALVSETSCEHRNMRLDRNLLLRSLP